MSHLYNSDYYPPIPTLQFDLLDAEHGTVIKFFHLRFPCDPPILS